MEVCIARIILEKLAQRENSECCNCQIFLGLYSGAPNENIVQNHLNMAMLNVFFWYLNGRYRNIFIPKHFSSVRIS